MKIEKKQLEKMIMIKMLGKKRSLRGKIKIPRKKLAKPFKKCLL